MKKRGSIGHSKKLAPFRPYFQAFLGIPVEKIGILRSLSSTFEIKSDSFTDLLEVSVTGKAREERE